jgi:hypothetical protein
MHWLQRLIRLISFLYRYMDNWLQGFIFAGRSLSAKNSCGYNLRGCDLSECELQQANFEGVVGSFCAVRPICLIVTVAVAVWIIATLQPLPPVAPPEIIKIPESVGAFFYTLLAVTLFLRLLLTTLNSKHLPQQIVSSSSTKDDWKQIEQARKVIWVIAPSYLGFGCYLFAQEALMLESVTDKLLFLTSATLFGMAAAFFRWTVGEMFIFHSSFAGSNLTGANFTGAKFPGCNFKKAVLYSANLQGADFSRCNFTAADLRFADLRGANLRGANLRYALTEGTIGLQEAIDEDA